MPHLICLLLAVVLVSPVAASPRAPAPAESLTALATRIGTAAIAGDRAVVLEQLIRYDELVALSPRAARRGKARWNEYVEDFLKSARHDRTHGVVVDANVVRTGTLTPANDEVTRDVDYAFVQLTIETDCSGCTTPRTRSNLRVFRMLFIRTAAGWRLAFK